MDNKITKRRFYDMASYFWLISAVASIIVIIVWAVVFGVVAVKLNAGQRFCYYYDDCVNGINNTVFFNSISENKGELNGVFSYDIIEVKSETMYAGENVLQYRMAVDEGDAIFTSKKTTSVKNEYNKNRAKEIIDDYNVLDYELLYNDAIEYLKTFLVDTNNDPTVFSNLSTEKISAHFYDRMKKDNRLRAGEISVDDELKRIEKLCIEIKKFNKVISSDIFYTYTKYEQTYFTGDALYKEIDEERYNYYKDNVGEKKYAIDLTKLTGGTESVSNYFLDVVNENINDLVLIVFDFRENNESASPLQYETISFVNKVVKMFSNILD